MSQKGQLICQDFTMGKIQMKIFASFPALQTRAVMISIIFRTAELLKMILSCCLTEKLVERKLLHFCALTYRACKLTSALN